MENEPGREPVRFDIQTQILDLLTQRMRAAATESQRNEAQGVPPVFEVQSFRVSDGTLRYYARAVWRWKEDQNSYYALAALVSPQPTLHILAVQRDTLWYDDLDTVFPSLLNVVDLGRGRTGILLLVSWGDSGATQLLEYRDGLDFEHMPVLQSIAAGE